MFSEMQMVESSEDIDEDVLVEVAEFLNLVSTNNKKTSDFLLSNDCMKKYVV
jgi:hypothetical protein